MYNIISKIKTFEPHTHTHTTDLDYLYVFKRLQNGDSKIFLTAIVEALQYL